MVLLPTHFAYGFAPNSSHFAMCDGAGLHAMDCVDIVIGAARGELSRILDYYTRDRSTPRPDEVYDGSDSLTAAIGEQTGSTTTFLFRRKLEGL